DLPNDQTFEIPAQFSQTKRSELVIIYDGYKKKYDERLLLFSTDELLQHLCETELVLVDGTFASAPTGFEQLVIIMGLINDEGYNNRIGNRFGNRPNIWLFLYRLLIEEQIIEQRIQQLIVGKIQTSDQKMIQ
ncbi:unnamed protein product, partial [Didymodactylos carnosus]